MKHADAVLRIEIGTRTISSTSAPFIIAEAGVNHNGDIELAKKLVDAANGAGADAVKFQTFKAEDLAAKEVEMADYQKRNIGNTQKQLEMLRSLELSDGEFRELKKHCDAAGIIFLSTPHTERSLDLLDEMMPVFKVASGDLTNTPFLGEIARKGKPVILSTGMGAMEEVKEAVSTVRKHNAPLIVLQCTTSYPCAREDVNLAVMATFRDEFNVLVGFSDHTTGIDVSLMAASLGARVIEKHITLAKSMAGPDHKASLNPDEFMKMVDDIKRGEKRECTREILGDGVKKPTPQEIEIAKTARKSIVAVRDIAPDETILRDMIAAKRPGTGIQPKHLDEIVGRKSKVLVTRDSLIRWDDIQ